MTSIIGGLCGVLGFLEKAVLFWVSLIGDTRIRVRICVRRTLFSYGVEGLGLG